ncbi:MAG TPA: alpha/beta hydrolase [Verrucomicrobiae bacterium]|nr:alpha/beta hydrolase [Verrucomicrobiae bacterium]
MIETKAVQAPDGVASAVRHAGIAGAALVFVHGVGSTAAIWDRQLDAFSGDYRTLAVELRGNGVPKPEPDPTAITRAGYAADVLAALDALQIERATIVGCSLGGVVAFELWERASARIEGMVILGSFAAYPNARAYADGIRNAVQAAGTMEAFARERASRLGAMPEARLRETLDQMANKSVASYLAATEATWTGDYRATLATIDVPVLVCVGESDVIASPVLSREIADGIAGCELASIPHAGHVANADNPDAFNALLRGFLAKAAVG